MRQSQNTSARKKGIYNNAIDEDLGKDVTQALAKERERKEKKELKKIGIEKSFSYKSIRTIKKWMDEYFLDGILGLFPVFGDIFTKIFSLPFIYVALFKIRSIPLTLAVIFNILVDVLIGSIPFFIGDIADFFYLSYKKNFELIVGFVEDDREIISKVNIQAFWIALGIVIICYLIYLVFSLAFTIYQSIYEWIASLFI